MNKPELKPCPFCGGSVTIGTGVVNSYFIVHVDWNKSKCPIRMTNIIPDADTPEKAIEAWNQSSYHTDDQSDTRNYVKIYCDSEPNEIAEKIYQLCDSREKLIEVRNELNEYIESEENEE